MVSVAGQRPAQVGAATNQRNDGTRDAMNGSAPPGPGVRLGVDPGQARIGLAISDPGGVLATPLSTVPRDRARGSDLARIAAIVRDYEVVEVVVGLPTTLAGHHGSSAQAATAYAEDLARCIAPVPVQLADERLTTVTATRQLAQRGVRGRAARAVVDQAAAVVILQDWLDTHRQSADRSASQPPTPPPSQPNRPGPGHDG